MRKHERGCLYYENRIRGKKNDGLRDLWNRIGCVKRFVLNACNWNYAKCRGKLYMGEKVPRTSVR